MSTFGGTTDIPFTGSSQWAQTNTLYKYKLDTSQNTSTSRFFELWDLRTSEPTYNSFISPAEYGMEIRHESNNETKLYLNASNNTNDPKYFGDANGNNLVESKVISSSDVGSTIYCWRSNGTENNASFTVVSGMLWSPAPSGGSGSGGGGGFLSNEDPRFTNVAFTKTEDDHVTLTFDFDEMDGTLSNYVVHKKAADGTETNSADNGISGSSGTITRTGAHIPILDGLAEGDQLWIEHSSNPIHIVWDNDGYGGIENPYVHRIVDWSIENVSGVKSVVARFFGVDTGLSIDHFITAVGPGINEQDSVFWDGTLQVVSERYKPSSTYSIQRNAGNTAPLYGTRFITKGGKVFSNFW